MDESLEVSGKTVEEAVEAGLRQLGIARDEADVVVLSRGRAGILGIGSETARVRVSHRVEPIVGPDDAARAHQILTTLLRLMGVDVEVQIASAEGDTPILLDVRGPDAGLLIGRRGASLQDLQSLTTTMISRSLKRYVPLRVDVEGYRARRMERVREVALRAGEHVRQGRRPITLEPMSAAERRVVHTTLADNPAVQTQSSGEGEERRVTISPRGFAGPRAPGGPGRPGARPSYVPFRAPAPPPPSPSDFPPDEDEEDDED
ncbi:MAG: protein jag [Chloroflexi bacterium]|nr:protein jag [Chloroflexota bacterium]